MIFRTINTDAKKLTEQFGLLNKSFRDIKKDFANGLGIKNSLFQTSISKTDYQALQKFNSAIKVTNDGLTKSQRITKAWNENMTGCSMAAKRMGNDLITGKKKISDVSNSMKTATASTKALGVAMNVFTNVGFMLVITAVTKVVTELAQAQSKAVEAAHEATESYKEELVTLEDYKTKISELHEELSSENISYKDSKTIREELLTLQDELIKKYGNEKTAIENITTAIKGEVNALDELNEKAYRDWIAKADKRSGWNKLLPWGQSGLDQAIDYMETEKTVSFLDMQNANLSEELQTIQKEIDETIKAKYNLDKTFAMFNVTGTPEEIKSQLEAIRQDYLDLSKDAFLENGISSEMWEVYRKEAIDSLNEVINKFDDGLEKHQETYQTYIEGMIKYDSEYSDEYATILQKRAELESAQNLGNEEEIQKARQTFMDAINKGIEESGSNENIRKYFESLYPELQAEFSSWNFEIALDANTDGLTDVANEIGEKYNAVDLLNMVNTEGTQEGEKSFNKLIDKAIEYGVCTDKSAEEVQKLIDLLVELGIVQDNVQGSTLNEADISLGIPETIDQLNTRLKPAMDSLKSTWQDIFTDDGLSLDNLDLLSTVDSIKSKLDELNKIDGITVDYSSFEDFVRILENTESTEENVKQGFNELAKSIVQASVSGIEDFQTLKDVLEDLGVVNNEIVAFQALAQNTDALKASGLDLLNATQYEIKAFASERVSVENLSEAIIYLTEQQKYLQFQTEINSFQNMDTSQEIANLKNLAKNAGITGDVISDLTELEQIYQAVASGVYGINTQQVAMAMERARQLKNKIQEEISKENLKAPEIEFPEVKFEPKIDESSAKKSADDLEKLTKDYVDAYMNYMEQSLKTGRIDYQTYARDVAKFLKDMYDQGKIAAKDYHDYTKQMLEVQKDIYDKALSAITGLLDDEIDKYEECIKAVEKQNDVLEEQKTLMENAASAVVDYIDSLIDGENEVIDALNKANDGIQEQLDKYDSLINVADRLYESEQNRLKDEQDAIQQKIDLLQEENDQKDLQYRKEQALYELQRSQQQRIKKVYVGGDKGYVYDTDKSAISDAKKNLQDIETEELISSLEKEKDALQGSIDALQEYRDALSDISDAYQKLVDERNAIELIGENYEDTILGMSAEDWTLLKNKYISANDEMADNENLIKSHENKIKIWESEKKNWSSLSSTIDTETKKQAASQQFGAYWEKQINNGRLVSFDEFKSKYLNIESQINDNDKLINSYNEKISYYENLKNQWSSVTSAYEDEMNKQYAAQLLGANWESDVLNGRLGTLDNFKNQYMSIQQQIADAAWKSANEQVRAAQEAAKGTDGNINDDSPDIKSELDKNKDANSRFNITYGDLSGFKQKLNDVEKYGASAVIAPKINNNTQNTNRNTGILDKYYEKLKRGSKYASGTKNAKKGLNLVGEDGVETYIDNNGNVSLVTEPTLIPMEGGEIVKNESETKSLLDGSNLVPLQTSDLFKKLSINMPDLSSMFKTNIPDYSNLVMRNNNVQQPSIVIGDIHLHEVQNVPDFAKALQKHLPNISVQYNGKH